MKINTKFLVVFLSFKEKQELINEWTPEPLVPKVKADNCLLNPRIIDG